MTHSCTHRNLLSFLAACSVGGALVPREALRLAHSRGLDGENIEWTPDMILGLLREAVASLPERENPVYMPQLKIFPHPDLWMNTASGRHISLQDGGVYISTPDHSAGHLICDQTDIDNFAQEWRDDRWLQRAEAAIAVNGFTNDPGLLERLGL